MKPHPKVLEWLAKNGRKGGRVKGPTKARSSDLARRAALVRWAKRNEEKGEA
jgi:hypothetical protein